MDTKKFKSWIPEQLEKIYSKRSVQLLRYIIYDLIMDRFDWYSSNTILILSRKWDYEIKFFLVYKHIWIKEKINF